MATMTPRMIFMTGGRVIIGERVGGCQSEFRLTTGVKVLPGVGRIVGVAAVRRVVDRVVAKKWFAPTGLSSDFSNPHQGNVMKAKLLSMLLLMAAATTAGATTSWGFEAPATGAWQSPLAQEHSLVGRIWDTANGGFISPEALLPQVRSAQYLLLGETHDNADHHRLQAWLIGQAGQNSQPAVVFEMINEGQSPALERYLASSSPTAAGLGPAIGWEDSGWPDWTLYQPVAEAAFAVGATFKPGSLSNAAIRGIGQRGLAESVSSEELERLALMQDWPEEFTAELHEELAESHCDLLPAEMLPQMAEIQRLRDAKLANAMVAARAEGHSPAILVAGTGHTGHRRAVPWYLAARQAEGPVLSIAMLEVVPGAETPGDYARRGDHDFLWFTPRAEREDPCESLAERFGKPGGGD